MVLWVNSHGGFIVGITLLGYVTLLSVLEDYAKSRQWKMPWHLVVVLVLSLFASLANPYGMEQLLFPFQLMDQWVMRYVSEWLPPDFSTWNYQLYAIVVTFFVLLSLFTTNAQRWFAVIFAAPFIIASFYSVRHVPIASFVVSPYFAVSLSRLFKRYRAIYPSAATTPDNSAGNSRSSPLKSDMGIVENILNWFLLVCFISIMYLAYPAIKEKKSSLFTQLFPVGATNYLIQNNIQGRMFTSMQYSDYILFHRYPEQKLFYDVRVEIYGETLSKDYMKMNFAYHGWRELFKKYRIDFAVLEKDKAAYTAFSHNSDFKILYEDDYSAIFSLPKTGGEENT